MSEFKFDFKSQEENEDKNKKPSLFDFSAPKQVDNNKPPFKFESNSNTTNTFSFGSKNKTKLNLGGDKKPNVLFGSSQTASASIFGNTQSKSNLFDTSNSKSNTTKQAFGMNPTTSFSFDKKKEKSSSFAFGQKKEESSKPSLTPIQKNEKKPSFSFDQKNDHKPASTVDQKNQDNSSTFSISAMDNKPSLFTTSNTSQTKQPSFSQDSKIPAFTKEPPPFEKRPDSDSTMDTDLEAIAIPKKYNVYLEEANGDATKDQDGDEQLEDSFEFDEKAQLEITRLPYDAAPISKNDLNWLKDGRTLNFQLSKHEDSGVLFLTSSKKEKQTEFNQKDTKEERKALKVKPDAEQKLYPFEIPSNVETSEEFVGFLNTMYHTYEPLLSHQAYRNYSQNKSEEDEMQIGLLNAIKDASEEKKVVLTSIMDSTVSNLRNLISEKLNEQDIEDNSLFNYEESLNVLLLLQALNYSSEEERLARFITWVDRANIPDDLLQEEAMTATKNPYENFLFWSTYMKKLILRGLFSDAIKALEDSKYNLLQLEDPQLFKLIIDFKTLLENYDIVQFSRDNRNFIYWKQSMVSLRDAASNTVNYKNKGIAAELYELMAIMSGYSSKIQEHSSSWYECFLAQYLYNMPSSELIDQYITSAEEKFEPDPMNYWEPACLDLFHGKYLTMISGLEVLNTPIATFVAILIEASGLLEKYSDLGSDGKDPRSAKEILSSSIDSMLEQIILSYLSQQKTFTLGVGFLITLDTPNSREVISEMLPNYEINSNDDFEWALSICAKLKLHQTAEKIYKLQGSSLINNGFLYESLYCFARAGDNDRLIDATWKMFENLLLDGLFNDSVLISKIENNEVEPAMLRQSLAPFVLLYQFFSDDEKYSPPFSKIFKLLEFKYLPAHYKIMLLVVLFPYFNKGVFELSDLMEVIKALNNYDKQIKSEDSSILQLSEQLYELALTKLNSGSTDKDVSFDWRNEKEYPPNVPSFLLHIRKIISYEVSFKFIDNMKI